MLTGPSQRNSQSTLTSRDGRHAITRCAQQACATARDSFVSGPSPSAAADASRPGLSALIDYGQQISSAGHFVNLGPRITQFIGIPAATCVSSSPDTWPDLRRPRRRRMPDLDLSMRSIRWTELLEVKNFSWPA
jgi:hypothetical protein